MNTYLLKATMTILKYQRLEIFYHLFRYYKIKKIYESYR